MLKAFWHNYSTEVQVSLMAPLISSQSLCKAYSSRVLFRDLSLAIDEKDQVGLIGPNGSGKSTLLKILDGQVEPDSGQVVSRRNLRTAYVPQEETFPPDSTVLKVVQAAAASVQALEHERSAAVDSTLAKLDFPDRLAKVSSLSGGWRKRLSLAAALAKRPELLFLDEPTNHLDLHGVLWLEEFLRSLSISFVLVSHDRAFLDAVSNRIIELNPIYEEGYLSVRGPYSQYLAKKDETLSAQANLQASLESKVRREIAWLQRGARARQTKARGRIQEAERLINGLSEVKKRNSLSTTMDGGFESSERKTKVLLDLKGIAKSYGDKKLFADLNLVIARGTKLGLVGKNGSGKSTLLKIILGEIKADQGTIKKADDLKIVCFDQNRAQLDQSKTLKECLSPTGDTIIYQGRNLHVATWARKFLFRTEQLSMPVSYLSGGEQARILLANIMQTPADVLILDEPTNDLDIPTLEVLEESLSEFGGAIILVSHDRMMLDVVSNRILGLNGRGGAYFFADYEQCELGLSTMESSKANGEPNGSENPKLGKETASTGKVEKKRSGLSTSEKRDLASMPEKIEIAELALKKIQEQMQSPSTATNFAKLQELMKDQEKAEQELETLYKRWQDLEQRSGL